VYRLSQEFPKLRIVINGGVRTTAETGAHLNKVDGVMIGRQAYSDPYWLTELQGLVSPEGAKWQAPTRESIVMQMAEYAGREQSKGTRLHHISRHMLGLYTGQPGARAWRRFLSEGAARRDSGPEVLLESLHTSIARSKLAC
jgi:tRNA-dihydrouridine synthase A